MKNKNHFLKCVITYKQQQQQQKYNENRKILQIHWIVVRKKIINQMEWKSMKKMSLYACEGHLLL